MTLVPTADIPSYAYYALAENKNTPVEVLRYLAKIGDTSVRCSVAKNPGAPLDLLFEMARDPGKEIRYWVCLNPSISSELLTLLADDPEVKGVVQNSKTPAGLLSTLARKKDKHIRSFVGKHAAF